MDAAVYAQTVETLKAASTTLGVTLTEEAPFWSLFLGNPAHYEAETGELWLNPELSDEDHIGCWVQGLGFAILGAPGDQPCVTWAAYEMTRRVLERWGMPTAHIVADLARCETCQSERAGDLEAAWTTLSEALGIE